jgi:hypothetical protein
MDDLCCNDGLFVYRLDPMNEASSIRQGLAVGAADVSPPLLFEMIRSFVALASTLNLSHAVLELGSTRQTLRRHIANIESAMGGVLFVVEDRRYQLSELGESVLPEAKEILARGNVWLRGQSKSAAGLQHLHAKDGDWCFYQQQQPLGQIWTDPSLLMRETFRAWTMAGCEIESPMLAHVRPYLIVYRKSDVGWICVEFGAKSVYVNWFGQDYARSSIGRPIKQLPAGEQFSQLIDQAFDEVQTAKIARLDHVFTWMPKAGGDGLSPVAYQRLILSGFFPDRSPALMSLIVPLDQPNISDLDAANLGQLDPVEPLEFSDEDAYFEKLIRGQ